MSQTNPEDKGIWRLLLVRMNKKGEVMIVVMIHPPENESPDSESPDIEDVKNITVKYFTEGEGKDLNIVSIFLHLDKDK